MKKQFTILSIIALLFLGSLVFAIPTVSSAECWIYGSAATEDYLTGECKCRAGYIMSDRHCTSGATACLLKNGGFSTYNESKGSCECLFGYTLDNTNRCVKKQNNVYFTLEELDTGNKKAIIRSNSDFNYYLVIYNTGCYDRSFERYLGKQIVINLGTDYYLDTLDKIVLQDDNETCDIISREKVDSSTTLKEEGVIIKRSYPSTVVPEIKRKQAAIPDTNNNPTKNSSVETNTNESGFNPFFVLVFIILSGGFVWIIWKSMKNNIERL
ncbi:MAG: hypothetical protein Q7S04_02970 [Candidatus Moranbacteria bacterium]|nr:hypothetical protein [Candidatus Moranbacteria bacterium]